MLLVVSQYLGSQRAAADVEAAQSRVDLAQAIYNQAADLQKNGVGTGIDTLRSNVQLQNEKQRLIVARTQLETSLYGSGAAAESRSQAARRTGRHGELLRNPGSQRRSDPGARLADPSGTATRSCSRSSAPNWNCAAAADARLPRVSVTGFWAQQGLNSSTAIPVYTYSGQRRRAALHRRPHPGRARQARKSRSAS